MKLFFSDAQLAHKPKQYMVHGRIVDPFESPERATTLLNALEKCGLDRTEPEDFGRAPILATHADHYVEFVAEAYDQFMELPNHGPEVLPNVHPYRGAPPDPVCRDSPRPIGIIGRAGWYMGDLSCAIMEGTFRAAYASAQTAIAGAEAVLAGEAAAFCLCRPPGHHAYADRASGFCYFNNAAIAAEVLRGSVFPCVEDRLRTVSVMGVEVDDGNLLKGVFYGSVHTDPSAYYPHFSGYADEIGTGEGQGATLNLPLAVGADDEAFVDANQRLALEVQAQRAEALVISAGWDAHHDDPLSKLAVTTEAFLSIGQIWGKLRLPTAIVQEGGYSLTAVAQAAPAFMQSFREALAKS